MSSLLKLFIIFCGGLFFLTIVTLLLKKRINERNSIAWLFASISVLVLAANPKLLDSFSEYLGVDYPPSILFLLANLILLVLVLYQSTQLSTLNEKITKLTQHVALMESLYKRDQESITVERRSL